MQAVQHKPFSLWVIAVVAVGVCLPLLLVPTEVLPWVLVGVAAATVALLLVHTSHLLTLLLGWLAVTSVFGVFFWVLEIPGFFNLTIDRIALAALVFMFLLAVALRRVEFQWPGGFGVLLLALVAWSALSAQLGGWALAPGAPPWRVPPYYRFFAGFLFPAILFFMAVSAVQREGQIRTVLLFFTMFGLYLTVTGLGELLGAHWLVFPKYVLDPGRGIHAERVRGPFLNAPDMGLTLVVCLFANLLLMTKVRASRAIPLLLISLPMPVLIFATLTRSIWLAFILCMAVAVWFWPRSGSVRRALGLLGLAAIIVLTTVLWSRLSSPQRERGGVADMSPVISRYELSLVSLDLAQRHPLIGVGLGHFQEGVLESPRMTQVASRAALYGLGAVEHNNFLSMLAETGVPGAVLYALVVFGLLAISIRLYRLIPPSALGYLDRRFVVFFWIAWVAFFVDSMFRLTTSSPFPNGMFLLLGGVAVGLFHRLRPQPVRLPPAPPGRGATLAGASRLQNASTTDLPEAGR